jgi:hypothetical protein
MNVFGHLKKVFFLCVISVLVQAQGLEKKYLENETYGYEDLLKAYGQLAERSEYVHVFHLMQTDCGEDLPVVVVSEDKKSEASFFQRDTSKLCILVLNGIHAGESNGVDASLHWTEQLIASPDILDDVDIYIIPVYNIGGYKNQSCCTRANQAGPNPMGFRGNANNLDLNRDFIKSDAKNTVAFHMLFQGIKPDLLIDTHATNGADYQYVMTLLPGPLERFSASNQTALRKWMEEVTIANSKKVKTGPYVSVWGRTPDRGYIAYRQTANLSGGYAALFGVPAITLETHMFKSYPERVEGCWATLNTIAEKAIENSEWLQSMSWNKQFQGDYYPIAWQTDSSTFTRLDFQGYEAETFTSELTSQQAYRYNRDKPKTFPIAIYDRWLPADSVKVPAHYLLHAGQHEVIELLMRNNVQLIKLERDTLVTCQVEYVVELETNNRAYEGHYNHKKVVTETRHVTEQFWAGDYLIDVSRQTNQYVFEVLEAKSESSFFRWNFFDTYLQQKEWFSSYIFEEKAIAFLAENPDVKIAFDQKRAEDEEFANNHFAQLYWVYRQTPYYEKEHMRIPVFMTYDEPKGE